MRTPHFLKLAEIDDHRFIMACRHGMVHLTWGRLTVRFTRDEFRRVAGILQRAIDGLPPVFVQDGEIHVTYRADSESELRLGTLVLLLRGDEIVELAGAAREAIHHLDDIIASGVWERQEADDEAPPDLTSTLRGTHFSLN
ncbi:MAG: hypothetical protein JXA93_01175 [Anaerolineae bacterium]|nr:hypothetical protein [Anaerolineae bacterium]